MAEPAPHNVLLVEDDTVLRSRLGRIIDAHPRLRLAKSTGDVKSAVAWLEDNRPDVLLVDLGLPDGHGTNIIRYAKQKDPSIESMVISVFADEHNVVSAIKAGATGYYDHGRSRPELEALIRIAPDALQCAAGALMTRRVESSTVRKGIS